MNDLIGRVQKELNKLQKTLQKEGDDLVTKIRSAAEKKAKSKNVPINPDEIAKLIETRIKKFEPAFEKFYKGVKTNASKYGIDLNSLETTLKKTTQSAASKLNMKESKKKKKAGKKKAAKKKTTTAAKKSTTASKKVTKKKASSKKSKAKKA